MEKQKSIHDQIFEFLFDIQVSKKQLELRKDKKFGDFGNTLLEIGAQPAIYPVGVALDEIKSLVEKESSIQMGNNPRFSTQIYSSPQNIKANISKDSRKSKANRLLALWASIGGNIDAKGDGALLAMMVNKFDLSAEEATTLGKFYKKIKQEENKQTSDKTLWGKDFMPSKTDRNFPELDMDILGEKYIQERLKTKNNIRKIAKEIVINDILKDNLKSQNTYSTNQINKDDLLRITEDKNITDEEKKNIILQKYFSSKGVNNEKAKIYSEHILIDNRNIWNENDTKYLSSAQNSIFKSIAFGIVSSRVRDGKLNLSQFPIEIHNIEKSLRTFVDNNKSTYSVKFQRVLLAKRFLDSSVNFNDIFLSGDWEKFETKGIGFSQIVKRVEVKDDQNNIVGSYITPGDSVMGKLLGKIYYLHPKNFINGILNNGELWLKLACGEDGKLNKKSLAYFLYTITPGRLIKRAFNQAVSPFNFIAQKIRTHILNPFFGKILRISKNILKSIFGLTGIGGFIISVVASFLGEKFEYYIIQIVQIFLIAIIGLIFGIFFSLDSIVDISYENIIENQHNEISQGETFKDSDWEIP